ncbi:MAG TPA: hypothetical protein VFJ82_25270 [Longimicrobium sp.]|nr:hypothetical protein [Longimicrobium sp.]
MEVGIIAGADDRTVRVAETHLDGAAGHVLVPGGHAFIMLRPDVHRLVHGFLRTGTFPAHHPAERRDQHPPNPITTHTGAFFLDSAWSAPGCCRGCGARWFKRVLPRRDPDAEKQKEDANEGLIRVLSLFLRVMVQPEADG